MSYDCDNVCDSFNCIVQSQYLFFVPFRVAGLNSQYYIVHYILFSRADITSRRICCTFRELSDLFLDGGEKSEIGRGLLDVASSFNGTVVLWYFLHFYIKDLLRPSHTAFRIGIYLIWVWYHSTVIYKFEVAENLLEITKILHTLLWLFHQNFSIL